jgi:hypothetical protein
MNPLETVLDTNVLISALRSRRGASFELLRLVGNERWQLHLSTALLLEYIVTHYSRNFAGVEQFAAVLILAFQPLRLRVDGRIKPVSSPVGRVADVPDGGSVGWMVRCGCVRTKFWRSESWTPRDPRLLGAVLL